MDREEYLQKKRDLDD
ncbi:hypothetical protein [Methyloceanibacter sp. wino2]|nr:hypothetical protein [Methyloceanibacter sp. wino2]